MEEFRELPEYPGYRIGNQGTIIGRSGRIMNPYLCKTNRYYMINIYVDGNNPKFSTVHRLVALAWIPNPENKPQVDHINRNRQDNRIENLRWTTRVENGNNHGVSKANKSGITGLSQHKRGAWIVRKFIMGVKYYKYFQERQDAEAYLASLPN